MKNIAFIVLILLTASFPSYAQKNKVQAAFNYYKEPYKQYDKALEAIEEAVLNEQTKSSAKAWYYRGLIHTSLYKNETYGSLCKNCLNTAYESFRKALELDPGNEWADEINSIRIPYLINMIFTEGVDQFRENKFNEALESFEKVSKMSPGDTSVILNAAYSADRAGQSAKALSYYQRLIDMKYNDINVYLSYYQLLRQENKLADALNIIRSGRQVYPDSLNLMLSEINTLLSLGKNDEASKALDAAIQKDPSNPSLYLALGSTYDNLASPRDSEGKELPKPDNTEELSAKAEQAYKRGLEINPDHYEMNYNLGALYYNKAAEMVNASASIKSDTEYEKARKKYEDKFREAQPYLEKAMQKNPRQNQDDNLMYEGTVNSLKTLYVRLGEMQKYDQIKDKVK